MRELQAADVIVYDRLVAAGVLELARREARRILVGKEGHGAACRQEEINALVVDLASPGERVVRPEGRRPDDLRPCRRGDRGLPGGRDPGPIVPGVTAALAAASALTLSLTHRRHAQRVQFVTGHDRDGQLPPHLDLDALADPRATTCVYMGREPPPPSPGAWSSTGSPAHSVTVVSNVSRPDQDETFATLDALAQNRVRFPEEGPTLVLIGDALDPTEDAIFVTSHAHAPGEIPVDTRHFAW